MVHFKLLGFSQHGPVRRFLFQRDNAGDRSLCTVDVDLTLARNFRLAMQDLPLLCTRLLQTECEIHPIASLTLSEAQMGVHSEENQVALKLDAEKGAMRSRRSSLAAAARNAATSTVQKASAGS